MRKRFIWCLLAAAVLSVPGCGSDQQIQIPDEPAPMPTQGPESMGAALPDQQR